MLESEEKLRASIAEALRDRASSLTAEWVEVVADRLDVERRDVLPSEYLLDHVPECLQAIAAFIERPENGFPTALVRDKMSALAHMRRYQGFGIRELLAEYEIFASLLQDLIQLAVADFEAEVSPVVVAAVVGDAKDGFSRLGLETARSYRIWSAREDAERVLQTTTFAAMLRHELRNQLGSAHTAAELLLEGNSDAERQQRLVGLILRSLDQALETVDVVKAVMSEQPDEDQPTWLPLSDLLYGVAGGHSTGSRVEIEILCDPDTRVPASRVSMVLLNLIDNALKYSDASKADGWVRVSAEFVGENGNPNDWVRISVADNGRGIDPSRHDAVFEFRVRGDDPEAGSGLGLALSRDIVRQIGGRMELDSKPGEGTRVSFVVPARPPSDDC